MAAQVKSLEATTAWEQTRYNRLVSAVRVALSRPGSTDGTAVLRDALEAGLAPDPAVLVDNDINPLQASD